MYTEREIVALGINPHFSDCRNMYHVDCNVSLGFLVKKTSVTVHSWRWNKFLSPYNTTDTW